MLRSGRCLYRLVPKAGGVSFVSRKKAPVTCLHAVRCMSGQGSSGGEQQDWSKAIVAGAVAVGVAGLIYYKKSNGDKESTPQRKEVVEKPPPPPPMVVGLPSKVPYLIIGAGTAGFAAYRSIRSMDPKAQVMLIGEEPYLPYMRPPLSKEMWYTDNRSLSQNLRFKQWNGKERSVFFEKEAYFCKPSELTERETGGVSVVTGIKVVKLDVRDQKVYLNNGQELAYDKVLIATGGYPKNLPIVKEAGPEVARRCTLFKTVEDFKSLDAVTQSSKSVAIIGGGFMGSELACALGKRGAETGMKIYQMFPEKGNMGMVLPEYLSKWSTEKVRKEGVEVIPETSLTGCRFDRSKRKIVLTINGSKEMLVDHIVVAVGLQPNVELSENAGLEVSKEHGGYLVNAELEARSNVWVAGDAACFYDIKLGRRRVEHHDHAVTSGRLAGENMTGASKPYWHQSMFWSDMGPEIGYEAIGIVDSSLPTVGVYAQADKSDTPRAVSEKTGDDLRSETPQDSVGSTEKPGEVAVGSKDNYGKGVIFYLHDKKVVGLVLWNVFNKMGVARKVLREGKEFDDLTEVAKLFNLYGDPEKESEEEKDAEESEEKVPM